MAGYALTWELNFAGPWGTAAWIVVGGALTIGMAAGVYELGKDRTSAPSVPRVDAVPIPRELTQNCKRYTVRVHAQGVDCGGTTGSTIGAPALTQTVPIPVAEGLALSAATQAMLGRRQLAIRAGVIIKAHNYIQTGPANGGRFGTKSFNVLGVPGGIRYDVDCFGDGPSFIA